VLIIKIRTNKEVENVNLLNDYLFTKLFGEKGCESETLHIINTFTENSFKDLTYVSNELEGQHKKDKKSITDVLITMGDGTFVNVESQIAEQKEFYKRSHFYNSKLYSIHLNVGDSYKELPKTIMISILDFDIHDLKEYHTTFILCEKNNREYSLDDITENHYIELPTFRKSKIF
jgi:predicted transposase/invertase (TIGR01784 family)